jgi:transposase InsO family protein
MIALEDRRALVDGIEQAHASGARLKPACEIVGITLRTLQRWQAEGGLELGDRRPLTTRPRPSHALSAAEREAVLSVANEARFADMPPARIVPALADEGVYLASESTFARLLRDRGQTRHRGRAKTPRPSRPPTTHVATAPRQVWCWDMTYLPAEVLGRRFYLYLILDLFSRKIVSWEVHETDDSHHASHLVARAALAEGIHGLEADQLPVLHGDNGATLKATTVLAMLQWLGIKPSYSRPRVSDDNAFVESLFRTAKYRPEFPTKGFADVTAARSWATDFVHWYNHEHAHSGIRYVSPAQRHAGDDVAILRKRQELYQRARDANPRRWSRSTRNWTPITVVTLNPERDTVIQEITDQRSSRSVA